MFPLPSAQVFRQIFPSDSRFDFALQVVAGIVGLLTLIPLGYLGLRAIDGDAGGLAVLFSARTHTIIAKSVLLMFSVMGGAAIIGVPFAWLTARTTLPFRHGFLALGLVGMAMPTYLTAVTYIAAFGPRGILQKALYPLFGVERLPSIYGFFGAWLVLTLCTFPYVVLPVRAALLRTTPALEGAASVLGADRWRIFRQIILPQCQRALLSGMLLAGLYSLSDFGATMMMQYDSFTRVIYLQYTTSFDRSRGAILALVLTIIMISLLAAERRVAARIPAIPLRTAVRPRLVPLGRWRASAYMFCVAVVGMATLVPFGIILRWLTTRLVTRNIDLNILEISANTLSASGMTAVLVAGVALPLALLATHRRPFNRWLVRLPYMAYILPGIVVGLAFVFFTARYLPTLYQTLPILIIAYALRFLPISLGVTKATLVQVDTHLQAVARSLGASVGQTALRVTIPLSRSGILAGMTLVFLAVMKEMPITLLMSPIGFDTFSYRIWSAYQESALSLIGLPGLLLMGSAALTLFLIVRRE